MEVDGEEEEEEEEEEEGEVEDEGEEEGEEEDEGEDEDDEGKGGKGVPPYSLAFRWAPVFGSLASRPEVSLLRRPEYALTAEVCFEPEADGPPGELGRVLAELPAEFTNLVQVAKDETAALVALASAVSGQAAAVPL